MRNPTPEELARTKEAETAARLEGALPPPGSPADHRARIEALEGALREQTRLRFEAETRLAVLKEEQLNVGELLRQRMALAHAIVELWYACRKDSANRLSSTEMGTNLNFRLDNLISIAEDEMLASIGVKTDVYSAQREFEARIAAWKAVTR